MRATLAFNGLINQRKLQNTLSNKNTKHLLFSWVPILKDYTDINLSHKLLTQHNTYEMKETPYILQPNKIKLFPMNFLELQAFSSKFHDISGLP